MKKSPTPRDLFIYALNILFNDHIGIIKKNIAKCSIDYILHENNVPIDAYSPFLKTKYSVKKLQYYEDRIKNGLPIVEDSLIARLVRTHNELSQGIIKRI